MEEIYQKLINEAKNASQKAYAKYSRFKVGAAVLCADNKVYTGCNVENASYGGTICAERTAAVKAVSEGQTEFLMIAVYADTQDFVYPCGICRQFLSEFAADHMKVIACGSSGKYQVYDLEELLPYAFTKFTQTEGSK